MSCNINIFLLFFCDVNYKILQISKKKPKKTEKNYKNFI